MSRYPIPVRLTTTTATTISSITTTTGSPEFHDEGQISGTSGVFILKIIDYTN